MTPDQQPPINLDTMHQLGIPEANVPETSIRT
jgi:hypothetical protein